MNREVTSRFASARAWVLYAAVATLGVAAGCKSSGGSYLWVDAVPKAMLAPETDATIHPGDLIGIRVWNQDANSVDRARVREDGKISIPFLNDVEVAGMEPTDLAMRLQVKLKGFIVNPVVTVIVHERRPTRITVVGNVARPGVYEVQHEAGVLFAIAAAGGITPFASEDRVFVLRNGYWAEGNPSPARIRFRYRDLLRGKAPAATFRLRNGDSVVVE